ncbi:SDR family NAD(P)-dependent oxidoreductase [Mycobacterium intracellulare]|uniref:SDR family NAD(P)-dependent oxidoreductase n=1 Tax=Mycobacterium intracellulare TaxID=1767 RepID=UPI00080B7DD5|nr:SDR family oxidoreductase [Mycobacterium intracellulare]OCB16491.1 short-chain dehydrogenase [Mycobacterium intracellulare subsp. yongonense]
MAVSNELTGRNALVTGATSGIGRAIAEGLAGRGAAVVLHGRDSSRGDAVVQAIQADGGVARFVAADLTDSDQVQQLAADAGDVDILVHSAGIYEFVPTAHTDAASFDRQIAVNMRAPFLLVAALAPEMVGRQNGSIVLIGSSSARTPAAVGAAYGASKAGTEMLARYWASEFGPSGVRVNAVSPGPVHTAGTAAMLGGHTAVLDETNARGRAGDPNEIADVVCFLLGPSSSYVNGAVLAADGGERSAR